MILQDKVINFLGDSITEGAGASCPQNGYVHVLERQFGLKKANNYGIGGTRYAVQQTPSADPVWDLDFCKRAESMEPEADAIVVFGGTNDFGHGDAPLGTMEDRTPDTFYGACHTLYRLLLEKYPTKPIVILTPLHRLQDEMNDYGTRPIALKQFVDIIRQTAEYYSLPLLDLYACSGIQPKVPVMQQTYMPDGLHPNDAGHALLADRIGKFLLGI